MIVGVPKEIKNNENRVALTPGGVKALTKAGHSVLVELGAGIGSSFMDKEYVQAGAEIVGEGAKVFAEADMIVKVKEPLSQEYELFQEGQILFTYLHLAPEPRLTEALLRKKVVGIAYETIQLEDGSLPLLTPMSEVAGRMSVQIGAQILEKIHGGKGILLGGVPGVPPAEVVVVGGGIVGVNASKMGIGLGAAVTILEKNPSRLGYLDNLFDGRVKTIMSNDHNLAEAVSKADLLIGAVLVPGAKAPRIVSEEMVKTMTPGSVIVDVAIDQGGCIETVDRVTTHSDPTYVKHGVVHYSVANMPGAVPRTSTLALTNVTLPYVLEIANKGYLAAIHGNKPLALGVNVIHGRLTYKAIAEELGLEYHPISEELSSSDILH